jgi:hypothetical protein
MWTLPGNDAVSIWSRLETIATSTPSTLGVPSFRLDSASNPGVLCLSNAKRSALRASAIFSLASAGDFSYTPKSEEVRAANRLVAVRQPNTQVSLGETG